MTAVDPREARIAELERNAEGERAKLQDTVMRAEARVRGLEAELTWSKQCYEKAASRCIELLEQSLELRANAITPHQRSVLDACAKAEIAPLKNPLERVLCCIDVADASAIAHAELARRAAEVGK